MELPLGGRRGFDGPAKRASASGADGQPQLAGVKAAARRFATHTPGSRVQAIRKEGVISHN